MSVKLKPILIDLNIGDQLTSISCGHVVVELIKFIAYQRLQIPYTYQWLKQVVTKKKMCENEDKKDSFQSERHFHVASTALDNLDYILKSIIQEINGPAIPEEVCISLGATPMTCKEVYRLILPTLCHKQQCHSTHIASDQKLQRNVFRTLVTSEMLSQVFFTSLPPTNMFVFLRKKSENNREILSDDNFVLANGHRISQKAQIIIMDFRSTDQNNLTCCNQFSIFGHSLDQDSNKLQSQDDLKEFDEIESTEMMKWYQSSYVMKGFKDCVVNGSSVTNGWQES